MLAVALTGGIGSGKSTVAGLLAARGAVVVDADRLVREAEAPGGEVYQAVVDRFGPGVVLPDGALDRRALARVVFADPSARAALERITHPAVRSAMADRLAEEAATDHVVVLDIPLLAETGSARALGPLGQGLAGIMVVDCPVEVAVSRLVAQRAMSEADARSRVAAQVSRETRLGLADVVIDNSRDQAHLEDEVERAWAWIEKRAEVGGG